MSSVDTVKGAVSADQLGATLMHEHLFIRSLELEVEYPEPEWNEEVLVAQARESLATLRAKGIGTVVDLTVFGLGRFVRRVQRVAQDLDLNIVVATGVYAMRDLPAYFHNHGPGRMIDEPEPLTRMMLKDLTVGIGDSGVRAGVIKAVTDVPGLTADIERSLTAACAAHVETGAPIITHSHAESGGGLEQLRFFLAHGVDVSRVVIGHCGDSTDLGYLTSIMDAGATIGMDRFGAGMYLDDASRIATVAALCAAGYAEHMVLSHDAAFYSVNSSPSWRREHYPDWHHHFISDSVLPALRSKGVSAEDIDQMMVRNPARVLAGATL